MAFGCGIVLSALTVFSSDEDCNRDLGAFLDCNNPKVISYLTTLERADIGKVLKGVQLTDGTIALKDYKFIGKAVGIGKGVSLYVVEFEKHRSAYIWIDRTGTELPVPRCPESVSFESAYVLSSIRQLRLEILL